MDEMMKEIGLKSIDELFSDIPLEIRSKLNLPDEKDELEVLRESNKILNKNRQMPCFLGAGVYNHFIPAGVNAIASRSEFYSSYTPYQPEISQGMLQVLFEYQSMIAELTGMDVVNSSMYDGATALGEAMRMAHSINRKKEVIVPKNMLWEKKSVLQNYICGLEMKIKEFEFDENGKIDLDNLKSLISEDTSAVYIENPNFFGVIDKNVMEVKDIIKNALLIVGVNPISLGLLKPPSSYQADIVIGEGQVLGNPMNFGGPLLGIFATKKEFTRKMPGRLVGTSEDADGKRAFVMTLQTREQHIRRGKATSNICSNEGLCALISTVYMGLLGKSGLKKVGEVNYVRANEVAKKINKIEGFEAPYYSPIFNEFVVSLLCKAEELQPYLLSKEIIGGLPLCIGNINAMLFNVTEMHTDEDIDKLIKALEGL